MFFAKPELTQPADYLLPCYNSIASPQSSVQSLFEESPGDAKKVQIVEYLNITTM